MAAENREPADLRSLEQELQRVKDLVLGLHQKVDRVISQVGIASSGQTAGPAKRLTVRFRRQISSIESEELAAFRERQLRSVELWVEQVLPANLVVENHFHRGDDRELKLGHQLHRLLSRVLEAGGNAVHADVLTAELRVDRGTLTTYISRLRKRLGPRPDHYIGTRKLKHRGDVEYFVKPGVAFCYVRRE